MTTRTKRLKIACLQDLKDVITYLGPLHLKAIKIDGIELEFDTTAQMIASRDTPATIDDQQEKVSKVRNGLADLLNDAEADELWST